jgi:hypothetical protein
VPVDAAALEFVEPLLERILAERELLRLGVSYFRRAAELRRRAARRRFAASLSNTSRTFTTVGADEVGASITDLVGLL